MSKRWVIRKFETSDLELCKTHFGRYCSDYEDLLKLGCEAFAAYEATTNDAIGIAWYATKDFHDSHYLNHTFKVNKNQVLQFAGEIALPYRNTQISANVFSVAWKYWEQCGKTELIATVDEKNLPSMRLLFHLGWKEAGEALTFHQFLRYRWARTEHYTGERHMQYKKRR